MLFEGPQPVADITVQFQIRSDEAQLSENQRVRLQQVILTRIQGQDVREFRSYCQLARVISDTDFESQVVALAASLVSLISRHAKWVLASATATATTQQPQALGRITPLLDFCRYESLATQRPAEVTFLSEYGWYRSSV